MANKFYLRENLLSMPGLGKDLFKLHLLEFLFLKRSAQFKVSGKILMVIDRPMCLVKINDNGGKNIKIDSSTKKQKGRKISIKIEKL